MPVNKDYFHFKSDVSTVMSRGRDVILDPNPSLGREDFYYKRHITAGIPSMYGRYLEPKFESLGLTFRLEKLATALFDQLIENTNLLYITARTLRRILRLLLLFLEVMELDGISN
ncbi:hypothetical protein JW979_12275 [bacterium]|nr:hypothetical protein [candidate division CSSED10-310 bacterium]